MPLRLPKEALWGIAAGAFVVVLVTGSMAIVMTRRMIQRRQIARIFPAGEERRRCHMRLTDEDVARIPGTRRALRNSMQTSEPSRGWTGLPSRENLPKRPLPAVQPPMPNTQGSNTALSWPLSPRLKRSNATPLVKLKVSPLTPINENSTRKPGKPPDIDKAVRSGENMDGNINTSNDLELQENRPSPGSDVFTSEVLKPKPLFHNKQRSISTPIISQNPNGHAKQSKAGVDLVLDARRKRESYLPRSTSLCSQQSGLVPDRPVPPLPFHFPASTRFERAKSPMESSSKWTSGNSLLSGDTSILDDAGSRVTSQAETDFTSVSAFSPPILGSHLLSHDFLDDFSIQEFQDPGNTSEVSPSISRFSSKPDVHKSFRASLVHSLPRSASSGLSMSLLNQGQSWNASSSSLKTDRLSPRRLNLAVPQTAERKNMIRRGVSSASPLKHSVLFESQEELKTKRASTSILKVVSGNESSPLHAKLEKRPSSIATSNPFQWDLTSSEHPRTPSAVKKQAKGHKRQIDLKIKNVGSAISITNIHDLDPLKNPLTTTQTRSPKPTTTSTPAISKHAPLRPPSRVTFDPQIKASFSSPKPTPSTIESNNNNNNKETDISIPSTPTKIPLSKSSGSNPNRHKTIFSNQGTATWSFLTPPPTTPPLPPSTSTSTPTPTPTPTHPPLRPPSLSSTSFLFPLPPYNPKLPPRRPQTQIRGPRPPHRSPISKSSRQPPFPTSTAIASSISSATHPTALDLRKSIASLRRSNSEAKDWDPVLHRRYLDLGVEGKGAVLEGEDGLGVGGGNGDGSRGNEGEGNGGGNKEGSGDGEWVINGVNWDGKRESELWTPSPGSLYCPMGFLKE